MKLKKQYNLIVSCDGGAASGKTTGAKKISKKYNLKFLSSGLLYRYTSYLLLKNKPKNRIAFIKKNFNKLNIRKLDKLNLQTAEISEYTSVIAKEKKIRNILKSFQKNFQKNIKNVA